jgi:adenine-specific DNA-methyltransferase
MRSTIHRARALRSRPTDAEKFLWKHLRLRQLDGYKFRRQRPVGPYIVDFVCLEKKLVIEVDGGQHAENQVADCRRDAWLRSQGYEVLRFWNDEVLKKIDGVSEVIFQALIRPLPYHPASGRKDPNPRVNNKPN